MLMLHDVSYIHPNKVLLFEHIDLTISHTDKIAVVGNNGSGKSTLLKIIAGELSPSSGNVLTKKGLYYVPQILGQYDHLTVAEVLGIDKKLIALKEILNGNVSDEHFLVLDDDWTLEERCREALDFWQLKDLDLFKTMNMLSGGQKTKVFLAGVLLHQPQSILLDEPSNHLDTAARELLYDFVRSVQCSLIVVSHDRTLLNFARKVYELSEQGLVAYGGSYDDYVKQKQKEAHILSQHLEDKEKDFRKAKEKERETAERQQKLDARGKGKQEKAGVARIMMNTLRNKAENSTARLRNVHTEKIDGIAQELQTLRTSLPDINKMKFGFASSSLHRGKILFTASQINFSYGRRLLWKSGQDLEIASGDRIALTGNNGSGKTTLINIIKGSLEPSVGRVYRACAEIVYVDQDYSLIHNGKQVYELARDYSTSALQEHEIKTRLNRFLFTKEYWDRSCAVLSGGEKMRLMLCCLTMSTQTPDMIILDEPTNNLDIQNIEILTTAINEYQGCLIVVSHDVNFRDRLHIGRTIDLE